jgi:hypothetical protein
VRFIEDLLEDLATRKNLGLQYNSLSTYGIKLEKLYVLSKTAKGSIASPLIENEEYLNIFNQME